MAAMSENEKAFRAALSIITAAVWKGNQEWRDIEYAFRLARDVRDANDPAATFRLRVRNHPELLKGVPMTWLPEGVKPTKVNP